MSSPMEETRARAEWEIANAVDQNTLKEIEVRYLGKKGIVSSLMSKMRDLPPDQRPAFGREVNLLKAALEAAVDEKRRQLRTAALMQEAADPFLDPTAPGLNEPAGGLHPITQVTREVEEIFKSMGFILADYPEAESEFFNFEALNIPKDHPARDIQDTFWLKDGNLLRTHTSPGQIRAMREFKPPFRAIFPGKVYRYEALDASHEHTFHQIEGLLIDKEVSVANLLHSMKMLIDGIFQREVRTRVRPGYFPFVEPGFELDMECLVCQGRGCSVCKQSGWVEMLPCGLVHPNVLEFGGLDPDEWSGWAFGLGLSRLVMMKYKIDDIRHFMGGDLRFLEQFI